MNAPAPILIWGAGAMGATLGVYLLRAGRAVRFVDANPAHVAALRNQGLSITGPILQQHFDVDACLPEKVQGRYPQVLLATKALHTRAACRQIKAHLTDDGVVVSVQNGLNEPVIAEILGDERTFGCFAFMPSIPVARSGARRRWHQA
ncbi:ketopantoate reductase family protein [Craterilacuibacter sp.]|uniref:ketopantoate reductase family protein n=1 Tax=Craterilacuibacter sp. TaxID=2870909 RepID=UPI003F31EF07